MSSEEFAYTRWEGFILGCAPEENVSEGAEQAGAEQTADVRRLPCFSEPQGPLGASNEGGGPALSPRGEPPQGNETAPIADAGHFIELLREESDIPLEQHGAFSPGNSAEATEKGCFGGRKAEASAQVLGLNAERPLFTGSGTAAAAALREVPPWSRWGEQRRAAAAVAADGSPPFGMSGGAIRSPFLHLHQEIVDLATFLSPTEEESKQRKAAVERVTSLVRGIWPLSKVQVFGSYATGLFLPSSDIDAVVLNSGCSSVSKGLKALAKALVGKAMAKNLQVIAHARVPIIKFVENESGVKFDISFDVTNGPDATSFILGSVSTLPPLRPLCLLLKLFLQQRGLNEVYTGGLGSYALLVMVMAHLQLHPSRPRREGLEQNLGVLLVDFFALYSRLLNLNDVGVTLQHGGRFIDKRLSGMFAPSKPFLLFIEDPQTSNNDLGRASFRIQIIRSAFRRALSLLTSPDNSNAAQGSGSLLSKILRVDHLLSVRPLPSLHSSPKRWPAPCELRGILPPPSNLESDFPRNTRPAELKERPSHAFSAKAFLSGKDRAQRGRKRFLDEDLLQEPQVHWRSGEKQTLLGSEGDRPLSKRLKGYRQDELPFNRSPTRVSKKPKTSSRAVRNRGWSHL